MSPDQLDMLLFNKKWHLVGHSTLIVGLLIAHEHKLLINCVIYDQAQFDALVDINQATV